MPLKREKRLAIGGVEVAVALEARRFEQITRSAPYRLALRPALHWLKRRAAGRNGHSSPAAAGVRSATVAAAPAAPLPTATTPEGQAILDRVAPIEWYHTLELPHGVVTPGFVDHREQVPLYGLPADMRGLRVVDVATFDGFWAFEMERRGAEVVAVDIESWAQIDFPRRMRAQALRDGAARQTGAGFGLAHELFGSRVERRLISVYDLAPEDVGTFDLVFVSDLLLHLRDPQRALESIFSVVGPGGYALIAEPYNPDLESIKDMAVTQFNGFHWLTWWMPSTTTLKEMMKVAGFERVEEVTRLRLDTRSGAVVHKVVLKGYPPE